MTNDLSLIATIADNLSSVITGLDADYNVKLYDTNISLVRGKYGFNVLPTDFITRDFTDNSSLPDIMIEMFCHYTMDSKDIRSAKWLEFLNKLNAIRNALLQKTNIPSPLATVKIDLNFNDDLLDSRIGGRAINCVMRFTYRKYAYNS